MLGCKKSLYPTLDYTALTVLGGCLETIVADIGFGFDGKSTKDFQIQTMKNKVKKSIENASKKPKTIHQNMEVSIQQADYYLVVRND